MKAAPSTPAPGACSGEDREKACRAPKMHQHVTDNGSGATVSAFKQFARQPCAALVWHATVTLTVVCGVVLLAPRSDLWQRRVCGRGLEAAQPAPAAQAPKAEDPNHAAFAICTIIKIMAGDAQWVDGRAEDLHEVRC